MMRSFVLLLALPAWCWSQSLTCTLEGPSPGPAVVVVAVSDAESLAPDRALQQLRHTRLLRGCLRLILSRGAFSARPVPRGWRPLEEIPSFDQDDRILILRTDSELRASQPRALGATVRGAPASTGPVLRELLGLELPWSDAWRAIDEESSGELVITVGSKHFRKLHRPGRQIRELRVAVRAYLRAQGMVGEGGDSQIFPPQAEGRTRVAVLDDDGAVSSSGHGPRWLQDEIARDPRFLVELVTAPEIRGDALEHADLLLVGGGLSRTMARSLGEGGGDAIRGFVARGGGFVGICAGAFLASQPRSRSPYLGLLPVTSRGNSGSVVTPLQWRASPLGSARLEHAKFSGGPTLAIAPSAKNVEVWARYAENPVIKSRTLALKGTPAVVSGKMGQGRAVIFGPHCERRPTPPDVFLSALSWAAAQEDR